MIKNTIIGVFKLYYVEDFKLYYVVVPWHIYTDMWIRPKSGKYSLYTTVYIFTSKVNRARFMKLIRKVKIKRYGSATLENVFNCLLWYSVHREIFRLSNYTLINFPMVRVASLSCDLNIDTSRTIVGRIFYFSSSNSTQGLVWVYNRTNRVDGPQMIFHFGRS